MATTIGKGIEVRGAPVDRSSEVLTADALDFVADLVRTFEPTRRQLLEARTARQAELSAGGDLGFLADTKAIRDGE